jgi:hypothetical protein
MSPVEFDQLIGLSLYFSMTFYLGFKEWGTAMRNKEKHH